MTNLVTVTELVTLKNTLKRLKTVFLRPNQLTTKTAGNRIKTATREMKKTMMTTAMLVVMAAGVMMLSAFVTPKQDAKAESSQIQMSDDAWKLFHSSVAYCDGDTDQCIGRGDVWINTDTYQVKFLISGYGHGNKGDGFDLTEYTGKNGYNYRFWHPDKKKYH